MKNLKNIFIIGPSRSGKTTFAGKLQKLGYNHIVMDAVIETMSECFPESGIRHGNLESDEFKTFLKSFCKNSFKYGLPYIIDLEVLDPNFAREMLDEEESTAVYLGYPNITVEEKIRQIREHDTKLDWTRNLNDEELRKTIGANIESSKRYKIEAEKNGFLFLDVSYSREIVFDNFIKVNTREGSEFLQRSTQSYDKYER